jgi:hypothetical protein
VNQPAKYCENCGTTLAPDSRFCEKCGTPVGPQPERAVSKKDVQPSPPPPLQNQQPPQRVILAAPKSKMKYLIGGGIAAVLILLAGIVIPYFLPHKASQNVQKQASGTTSKQPAFTKATSVGPETSPPASTVKEGTVSSQENTSGGDSQQKVFTNNGNQPQSESTTVKSNAKVPISRNNDADAAKAQLIRKQRAKRTAELQSQQASTGLVPGGRTVPVTPGKIFSIGNIDRVINGPYEATSFRTNRTYTVTLLQTYHWNDGRGAKGGTIGLRNAQGRVYGPWRVTTEGGSGARDVIWICRPNQALPAGTYTVVDSNPDTWSHNQASGGRGFVEVQGVGTRSGSR